LDAKIAAYGELPPRWTFHDFNAPEIPTNTFPAYENAIDDAFGIECCQIIKAKGLPKAALNAGGWNVLVIWECEAALAARVSSFLKR
jgi:hypothetical protein